MRIQKIFYTIAALFLFIVALAPLAAAQDIGDKQSGLASWYGAKYHGRKTSSGEVFNRHKLTAAHNGLPLGSKVKVTNVTTGKSVIVRINDRGPFGGPRVIDLSEAAARQLKTREAGLAEVTVEVLDLPDYFLASRAKLKKSNVTEIPTLETVMPTTAVASTQIKTPLAEVPVSKVSTVALPSGPVLAKHHVFVVQAGAFSSLSSAEAQVERLRRIYQKLPISLVEETVNGRKVHRILAGRFISKSIADQARQDLDNKGFQGLVKDMSKPAEATLIMASASSIK
jgi:rare lipoprotein A